MERTTWHSGTLQKVGRSRHLPGASRWQGAPWTTDYDSPQPPIICDNPLKFYYRLCARMEWRGLVSCVSSWGGVVQFGSMWDPSAPKSLKTFLVTRNVSETETKKQRRWDTYEDFYEPCSVTPLSTLVTGCVWVWMQTCKNKGREHTHTHTHTNMYRHNGVWIFLNTHALGKKKDKSCVQKNWFPARGSIWVSHQLEFCVTCETCLCEFLLICAEKSFFERIWKKLERLKEWMCSYVISAGKNDNKL